MYNVYIYTNKLKKSILYLISQTHKAASSEIANRKHF